jgi:hypothetical protein
MVKRQRASEGMNVDNASEMMRLWELFKLELSDGGVMIQKDRLTSIVHTNLNGPLGNLRS